MTRPSDSTHQRKPLSHASPCVRTPGAGIDRTISPLSGSIRNSFPDAGTAIQYFPSTHFTPCPPETVDCGVILPYMPDPGVTHDFSVVPLFGSTFNVRGGSLGSRIFVEVIHSAPLPYVMPLPWIDSVCSSWMIDPSCGRTLKALLGST